MATGSQFVGHTLGHYHIIEQIGAGGMGVIYRAHDEQLERDVAIKVLPVGTLTDEAARKRFRKEALALAKLNHPNIATIFEFSSQDGKDYLVTEYISGSTLYEKLAAGALAEKEVVDLGIQLAQGLSAAHEHGIVHRDLKPENLRLTPDQRVKILDFGLAQLMPRASELGLTATLTQSQEVTGTLPYMAPEQLRAGVADTRSDIWAVGAVLYEMATAHRPFEEKVPTALTDDIIHKAPPSPRSLKQTLSPKLAAVILKCLQKEPARRYQSARELQTDLQRLSTGASPLATRRRLWPVIAASAIVVVMLAVGAFLSRRRNPRLTEKDTIVLADFTNSTGDSVFDETLKQALTVGLEQSPFLDILSEQKVQETLLLMGRPPGERLNEGMAREVCQRTASAAVLAGSISSLGTEYVVGLNAVNCQTGDRLALEQEQATKKENVLKALDQMIVKVRATLGESLVTVEKYDTPIQEATTSSLDALKAFSLGIKTQSEKGDVAAIPFFERAVELDPGFALAYAQLGSTYIANLSEPGLAAESIRKAYKLRDRVSDRERFLITGVYDSFVTGELEKALQSYDVWAQAYPRDSEPHLLAGLMYIYLGEYEKSAAEEREAIRLSPDNILAYYNLIEDYVALNQVEEAKTLYRQAINRKLDGVFLHDDMYLISFIQGDAEEMKRQVFWSAGKPGIEDVLLSAQSDSEGFYGHKARAETFSRQAIQSAQRAGLNETAALWELNSALREAEFGSSGKARREAKAALTIASTRDVKILAALSLARAGDTTQAKALSDELEKQFPFNTPLSSYWLPTIHACIEIHRGNPAHALELLQPATPVELGFPPPQFGPGATLYPVYVRGQVHLLLNQGKEAANEFQKILDHRNMLGNSPLFSLAHLQLARARSLSGDAPGARKSHQDFLALWKDADPDIPILKQAKAEYARLQ
jgi:eukaryotic-like serine/threonine-protein kinase